MNDGIIIPRIIFLCVAMSTEQLISSVAGSSWGDIGEELEEKLSSGDRYGKKRGKKKNDNEKKQGLIKGGQKSNRSVGSVVARASTSKVSQQEGIVKEEGSPNKSLEFFKKVNHGMEGKLESKKASEDSLANVESKIDSRLDQRGRMLLVRILELETMNFAKKVC